MSGQDTQVINGPDLQEVTAKNIGFTALNGENRIQLLKTPWQNESLPSQTGSFLSIASGRGLLAAASPDTIVITSTHALRSALAATQEKSAKLEVPPQLSFPVPTRLSHVCFSSDERYLILAAEVGGGLAVYEVDSLSQGNQSPSFQIPTDGVPLRSVIPNPAPESGHQIALVRTDGAFCMLDLQAQALQASSNGNGNVLSSNISCAAWSVRGKQLLAGMADGNIVQLKPTGDLVAAIPKPQSLDHNEHVGAIYWLANDDFITVHVPPAGTNSFDARPEYHLVQREKSTNHFIYSKFDIDPAMPGFDRDESIVPQHFFSRLRDFKPDLADLLLVTCTKTDRIGMLAKSNKPFPEHPGSEGQFVTATTEESRSAGMPYASWPTGLALDLSVTEKLRQPLPAALEYEESPTPLPAVMALSNDGLLSIWWLIYDDSIKAGTGFEGLVAIGGAAKTPALQAPATPAAAPSPFAAGAAQSQTPSFGFQKPAAGAATFGTPSMGQKASPWGSATNTAQASGAAFGRTSTFGQPSAFGKPSFGQPSAFGSPSAVGATGKVFGQGGDKAPDAAQASPFAQAAGIASPFSAFSNAGGFSGLGQKSTQSAFAKPGSQSPFAQAGPTNQSPFANTFGNKPAAPAFGTPSGSFGQPSGSFGQPSGTSGLKNETSFASTLTLDSSKDGSANASSKFSIINPSTGNTPASQQSVFGSAAGSSFASMSMESDMSGTDDRGEKEATPTPQPKPDDKSAGLFGSGGGAFKLGTTFKGDGTAKDDGPKPAEGSSFFGSAFGNALQQKPSEPTTPNKFIIDQSTKGKIDNPVPAAQFPTPAKPAFTFGGASAGAGLLGESGTPKTSPPKKSLFDNIDAAPLPPDFTKASKTASEDAPLPPDFTKTPKARDEDAPLPPDFTKLPRKSAEEPPPLPPDFLGGSKSAASKGDSRPSPPIKQEEDDDDIPPIAGSPPIDIQAPDSRSASEAEDDEEEGDDGFQVEEHESADEDANELEGVGQQSPHRRTSRPIPPGNNWSFQSSTMSNQAPPPAPTPPTKSRSPSRSPVRSGLRNQIFPSTTPIGIPKGPVFNPPASRGPESPRSPSPIRSASTPHFGQARPALPSIKPPSRPISRAKAATPPPPEPSIDDLENEEDDKIRAELDAPVVPTLDIDTFVVSARANIDTKEAKPGIPGQINRVYRDINNMIDTLGLNSKILASFIEGHSEEPDEDDRKDIEDIREIIYGQEELADGWHLVEINDLVAIEEDLSEYLEEGRISDKHEKLNSLTDLHRNITRLRTRAKALERQLKQGLSTKSESFNAPLTTEQSYQQRTLRKAFSDLQSRLRETEDAVVMLRTKLAGLTQTPRDTPTVEAVTKTILRMNEMINQKSGDLAVLELDMRSLRIGSTEPRSTPSRSLANSQIRNGNGGFSVELESSDDEDENKTTDSPAKLIPGAFRSPFATPQGKQPRFGSSEAPSSGRSAATGAWHTPGSTFASPAASGFLLEGRGEEVVRERVERMRRRRELVGVFGRKLVGGGRRVSVFEG